MAELIFDAATHTYTLGGKRLPSVTEIIQDCRLEDYSMVPPDVLEAAREFGSHVHQATHLFDLGELDWATLDPEIKPYVEAWGTFLDDTGAVVIASEQPVVHEKLGYAGTPDRGLAWDSRIVIPDLKATAVVPRTVGIQTSAYAEAYQSMRGGRKPDRCCVHLTPNAKGRPYKSHPRRELSDWSMFLSALNCWRFRHAN